MKILMTKIMLLRTLAKKMLAIKPCLRLLCWSVLFLSGPLQATVTVRYQHTDVLGSVILETDAAGQVIGASHQYQPFGERLGGQKSGLGYTGHLEDTALQLTYMQQRYYDPVIGRFYSNDPVGFTASNPMMFNRYTYANNNPYKFKDPDGRKVKFVGSPSETLIMKTSFAKIKISSLGNYMIATSLEASKNTHLVVASQTSNNPNVSPLGVTENAGNGKGTGSITIINPSEGVETINKDGSRVINSKEAVMAHEVLGHASDIDKGILDTTKLLNGEKVSEINAMKPEREYKERNFEKPRDCHTKC